MILTLSTASSLYWLGRYMVRAQALFQFLRDNDPQNTAAYARLFQLLPQSSLETLQRAVHDPQQVGSLPHNLAGIEDNTQAIRGILPCSVFILLHALWRQREQGDAYVADLLARARLELLGIDAMALIFWQLGEAMESYDMALRFGQSAQSAALALQQAGQRLPIPAWSPQVQLINQLVQQPDGRHLAALCGSIQLAFAEGVA